MSTSLPRRALGHHRQTGIAIPAAPKLELRAAQPPDNAPIFRLEALMRGGSTTVLILINADGLAVADMADGSGG